MSKTQKGLQIKFERTVEEVSDIIIGRFDELVNYYIHNANPKIIDGIIISLAEDFIETDFEKNGLYRVYYLFSKDCDEYQSEENKLFEAIFQRVKINYSNFTFRMYWRDGNKCIMELMLKVQPELTGAMFLAEGKKIWDDMVNYYITSMTTELERLSGSKLEGDRILFTTFAHENKLSFCRKQAMEMFEKISKHFEELGFEIWLEDKKDVRQIYPRTKYSWEVKVIQF